MVREDDWMAERKPSVRELEQENLANLENLAKKVKQVEQAVR
jgi:hypothetical protein